jgi:hypothetical protein
MIFVRLGGGKNQLQKIPDAEQFWPHQPTEALLPVSI